MVTAKRSGCLLVPLRSRTNWGWGWGGQNLRRLEDLSHSGCQGCQLPNTDSIHLRATHWSNVNWILSYLYNTQGVTRGKRPETVLKNLLTEAKASCVQSQSSYTEYNVGQRSANKSLQARSSSHLCFKIRGFGKPAYIFIHLYLVYQLQSWLDTAETMSIVEDCNTH